MTETAVSTSWQPQLVTPGPEMETLRRFFYDCSWTGTVYAQMQGPGSPEMRAVGAMRCQPLMDGLWLACDGFQDQFVDGQKVLTWHLHLVIGWDRAAAAYRAVLVDSNGTAALLSGAIEGARLVMTPVGDVPTAGQTGTIRLIWDATEPNAVQWINEASINGGPWMRIEDYVMVPTP